MKKYRLFVVMLLLMMQYNLVAQEGDYFYSQLPFSEIISLAKDKDKVYAASKYGVFTYDISEHTISMLTKVEGLSDVGINCISYNDQEKCLLIAYENANIDILKDGRVINISDIKRKPIMADKSIYRVMMKDKYAYLSCGFGIVVLDLQREEIKDTYKVGSGGTMIRVNDLAFDVKQKKYFAATENGILSAPESGVNLAYYENWSPVSLPAACENIHRISVYDTCLIFSIRTGVFGQDTIFYGNANGWSYIQSEQSIPVKNIKVIDENLYIVYEYGVRVYDKNFTRQEAIYNYGNGKSPQSNDVLYFDGYYWIADKFFGLVKIKSNYQAEYIEVSGPQFVSSFDMDTFQEQVWVTSGGYDQGDWSPANLRHGIYGYKDAHWKSYNRFNNKVFDTIRDMTCIAIEPSLGEKRYIGTWSDGVIEMVGDEVTNIYNESNSSLQGNIAAKDWVQISGMQFDKKGNLWVVNTGAPNVLSVMKPNGQWKSFNLGMETGGGYLGKMIIDKYDQKWILMRGQRIIVFNDNGTIDNDSDDQVRVLSASPGSGGLPGNSAVRSIASDLDGNVWVGTDRGVGVFNNTNKIFEQGTVNAYKPKVEIGGYVQYLLEAEVVTAISVDGAGNLWFGTERAGVFLMDPDATEQLKHFNVSNSPLYSNEISSIAINSNGIVFIGTGKGIIAYKGKATPGAENNKNIDVFPNPVQSDYKGPVTIKNLVKDAVVKITDLSGNIVYEAVSHGGQVLWDVRNFDGREVVSGYYLIFVADKGEGKDTNVTKILILK